MVALESRQTQQEVAGIIRRPGRGPTVAAAVRSSVATSLISSEPPINNHNFQLLNTSLLLTSGKRGVGWE